MQKNQSEFLISLLTFLFKQTKISLYNYLFTIIYTLDLISDSKLRPEKYFEENWRVYSSSTYTLKSLLIRKLKR